MEKQTVRHTKAGAFQKPNGAASSVFDIARPEKPKRQHGPAIDPAAVQIERGVPLPEITRGKVSPWPHVYQRMKKGDMVRLTKKQATSFLSWAKSAKKNLARRTLDLDTAGVWRIE